MLTNPPEGNLTFKLCGNAYYNEPGSYSSYVQLWAQIYIAECPQFYNFISPPSNITWTPVFATGPQATDIAPVSGGGGGLICFDYTGEFNIGATCEYHAAVGLYVTTDSGGGLYDLDFSFQLRVTH